MGSRDSSTAATKPVAATAGDHHRSRRSGNNRHVHSVAAAGLPRRAVDQTAGPSVADESAAAHLPRIVHGRSGDHAAVHQLLLAVNQGPSPAEFQALLDDPLYEPSDRLLVKHGTQILSHVHLLKRSLCFGRVRIPMATAAHLATLPEHRHHEYVDQLLTAAERQMTEDGALLAMLITRHPQTHERAGYCVCGRPSYSRAGARAILAGIPQERPSLLAPPRPPLNIRHWRHFELPALMRLYRAAVQGRVGPLARSESYWRWLISRQAYDHIFIAIDGPDRHELEDITSPIVGYAVVRRGEILELVSQSGDAVIARQLLARACSDVIEHNEDTITLHAPPDDPLHEVLVLAGGAYYREAVDQGAVLMAKLVADPPRVFTHVAAELHARVKAAGIARPCEVGLKIEDEKYQVSLTRRSVRMAHGGLGRNHLCVGAPLLARLLLGHCAAAEAIEAGQLTASTRAAAEAAAGLFPPVAAWHPPWDDMAA